MKLTKRSIDSFRYQGDGHSRDVRWDGTVRGLGLRIYPSGRKAFVLSYRVNGRKRLFTVGTYGALTLDRARIKAQKLLGGLDDGSDPLEIRHAGRDAPTMAQLCDAYLVDYATGRKKASSLDQDRRLIARFVKPALGARKVANVTRQDVLRLHNSLRVTPYQANRMLGLLSKMMNVAEQWGYRPGGSNPCRHLEKFRERKRERFLSAPELGALARALVDAEKDKSELPSVVPALRLLLFTGARLSEILTLKWEHVDFSHGCLRLPDSKTGEKVIQLNAPALAVLSGLERHEGNPHVIVGQRLGACLVNLEKPWRRLRARASVYLWNADGGSRAGKLVVQLAKKLGRTPSYAECAREARHQKIELPLGLRNMRLHDLRHSFASVGAATGHGLIMIGALLGHRETATTARYAHLADDPLRRANEAIGAWLEAAMKGGGTGEIVELTRTR